MSDRRPSNELWVKDGGGWFVATSDEVLAVVRRGVESGTIKGEEVEVSRMEADASGRVLLVTDQAGTFIVIGPVSDGGEDRP